MYQNPSVSVFNGRGFVPFLAHLEQIDVPVVDIV
jgi:hypothetical protein